MNLKAERTYIRNEIALDAIRYTNAGVAITCKANCGGCCHVKVSVFPQEVKEILSLGVKIDMDKLEKQFNDWDNSDKSCIFLKKGNCSIEDNKPLSCISHLVNSDPKYCAVDSLKPPHMVRVKTVQERLKNLRQDNPMVILHEQIYERR